MKREVNLKIQFTNRWLYFVCVFGLFVLSSFFVYAYNSGASPVLVGHSGDEIHVTINGETKLLNEAFDELAFSCPEGFTLVESQGYVLGCIQNDEEGTADAFTAIDICFTKYGGRLPDVSEWFIGLNNSDLSNEIDDNEWTNDAGYVSIFNLCGSGSLTTCSSNTWTGINAFRCFIPN